VGDDEEAGMSGCKHILLLQGHGNGEEAMARHLSARARVVLIQKGHERRVAVWENGIRLHNGATERNGFWRADDATLNHLSSAWMRREALRAMQGYYWRSEPYDKPYDLCIACGYDAMRTALQLKRGGHVGRIVMLICDFLPVQGTGLQALHRLMAGWLTARMTGRADGLWRVSPRIPNFGRADVKTMPLMIGQATLQTPKRKAVAYVGYPCEDHLLPVLFSAAGEAGFVVELVGDNPFLRSLEIPSHVNLRGTITERAALDRAIGHCCSGWGVYRGGPASWVWYGVHGKLYTYLEHGVAPIFSDNVFNADALSACGWQLPHPEDAAQALERAWTERDEQPRRIARFVEEQNRKARAFLDHEVNG
jgi:hypothetical protein